MSALWSWLGVWSLATGWLLLVSFFIPADERGWAFLGAGVLLLILAARRVRWRRVDPWFYLLALPLAAAALVWPLPFQAGPLLLLAGLLLSLPLRRAPWLTPLCLGLGLVGALWIAQGGAVVAYWWLGARYHEAAFLTPGIQALARLLGWTVGRSGGALFLPHIEEMVQATTTWERLGALPVMLLAAGGAALLPLLLWESLSRRALRLLGALLAGGGYVLLRYLALTAALAINPNPIAFWLPLPLALSFLPLSFLLATVLPLRRALAEPISTAHRQPTGRYLALGGLALLAGWAAIAQAACSWTNTTATGSGPPRSWTPNGTDRNRATTITAWASG